MKALSWLTDHMLAARKRRCGEVTAGAGCRKVSRLSNGSVALPSTSMSAVTRGME